MARLCARLTQGPFLRNLGGAVALQLALLISGVLSARMLGPENRGYLAIFAIWSSTICQLGAVGISLTATYYLASGRVSGREIIALLRGSVALQVVALTAVYGAIIFCYIALKDAPIVLAAYFSLGLVSAAFASDSGIALALGGRRHGLASGLRAGAPVLGAGGMVYLYVQGAGTLEAVTAAFTVSAVIAGLIALALGVRVASSLRVRASLLQTTDRRTVRREILRFGRRGYVGYLAPTDTLRVDQLVVGLLLSPRALGIYVVGAAFTTLTKTLAVNLGLSATSEVAACQDPVERRQFVRRTLFIAAGLIVAINVLVAAAVFVAIPVLFGDEYQESVLIAELLLVASGLLSIKRVAVDLLRGDGELRVGTKAEAITLAVFGVLCVPAGLAVGGAGVAAAMVIGTITGSVYLVRELRRQGYLHRQ